MSNTNTFEINNYSVTTSLNERTIYVKIIDNISFNIYEGNVEAKELRLPFELGDSYKLMCNCFTKENGHAIIITLNSGIMKLEFNANVAGYLKVNFEFLLREKIMSNDGQLTLNFNRIEQKQEQAIKLLTDRLNKMDTLMESLSYAEICLMPNGNFTNWQNVNSGSHYPFVKLNTKTLSLSSNGWDYNKIQYLYQLETLALNSCPDFTSFTISNKSLKELCLTNVNLHSLNGIHGLPNLQKLSITSGGSNLRDVTSVLSSKKHKIKHLFIKNCTSVNNTELMTYCQKNEIQLELI